MTTKKGFTEKIQPHRKRPRQSAGVYDPMEQAGHADMVNVEIAIKIHNEVVAELEERNKRNIESMSKVIFTMTTAYKELKQKLQKLLEEFPKTIRHEISAPDPVCETTYHTIEHDLIFADDKRFYEWRKKFKRLLKELEK